MGRRKRGTERDARFIYPYSCGISFRFWTEEGPSLAHSATGKEVERRRVAYFGDCEVAKHGGSKLARLPRPVLPRAARESYAPEAAEISLRETPKQNTTIEH